MVYHTNRRLTAKHFKGNGVRFAEEHFWKKQFKARGLSLQGEVQLCSGFSIVSSRCVFHGAGGYKTPQRWEFFSSVRVSAFIKKAFYFLFTPHG